MKPTYLFFIFLALAGEASARLGETQAEIQIRYGNGKLIFQRIPETEQYTYSKNGFEICVIFSNGKSIWELFKRGGKSITDEDIEALIKSVSPEGNWTYSRKDKLWHKNARKILAYRDPRHDEWLWVRDEAQVAPLEKKKKTDVTGF